MARDINLEKTILVWTDVDNLPKDILKAVGGFIDDLNYVAFVPEKCDFPVWWEYDGNTKFRKVPYNNGTIYIGQH